MRFLKIFHKPKRILEVFRAMAVTPNWLTLTAAYLGMRRHYPFSIHTRTGHFEFQTLFDVATFWLVHVTRTYPVSAGARNIVDAGANIGAFTLFALQNAPDAHVVAIEPAPDSFARLVTMLRDNGVASRCTAIQAAVGGRPGTTEIDLAPASQFRKVGAARGCEVRVITLQQIVGMYGCIDQVKMDIEGAEYPTLCETPKEVLRQVAALSMEYHPVEERLGCLDRLIPHLEAAGFHVAFHHDDGGGYGTMHLIR